MAISEAELDDLISDYGNATLAYGRGQMNLPQVATARTRLVAALRAQRDEVWNQAIETASNVTLSHNSFDCLELRGCKCETFAAATKIINALEAARDAPEGEKRGIRGEDENEV